MLPFLAIVACTDGDDGHPKDRPCDLPSPFTTWEDPVACELRRGVDGLDLREGWFDYFTAEDCAASVEEFGTCFGNQPASPYNQVRFAEDDDGALLPTYQLDPDEALLYVGRTPPAARYWGFNHYQFWKAVPGSEPVATFGTNAPSLNLLTAAGLGEDKFEQPIAVLFTANRTTWELARERLVPILQGRGWPEDALNLVTIGYVDDAGYEALLADAAYGPEQAFRIRMGYGPDADRHTMVVRVADPEDPAHPYLDPAVVPATVWKITPHDRPGHDPLPFPHLPPEDETGETQGAALRAARDVAAERIRQDFEALGYTVHVVPFDNSAQKTSESCINEDYACGGNNDDARYLRSDQRYSIPRLRNREAAVFVVGVIHDRVPEAVPTAPPVMYSSLSLLDYSDGVGVETWMDRDLEGSFRELFPQGVPGVGEDEADLLYVRAFARVCPEGTEAVCVTLPAEGPLPIDANDLFWFTERAYLNQTSKTAPHESSVVEPTLIAVATDIVWHDELGPVFQHYELD